MTEGWKSLRARFEKLNENHQQEGKTQLNSLQSQNPSKLGVFLYRNRNQDIFSNEEELNSLEKSYQAILKETNNPYLKNKSPIETLDRISTRYSKLRSQAESKLTTSSPRIQLKRFKADHGSTFFSCTAIHQPVIEVFEEVTNDEPEEEVIVEEPVEIPVEPSQIVEDENHELTSEDLTPQDMEDEFYEEYEEYEEHPVVSTSPIDTNKTNVEITSSSTEESLQGSLVVVDDKSSDLTSPVIDLTPIETIQQTIVEDHVVEFEEEDYMESFEEYEIEETHVVDIATEEVLQTSITIETEETKPTASLEPSHIEETITIIDEVIPKPSTKPQTEEVSSTPSIEEITTPLQNQKEPEPVFVETQLLNEKAINSLDIVEPMTKSLPSSSSIVEKASSSKVEEKRSPKISKITENSPEKQKVISSTPNVNETKEKKSVSVTQEIVKLPEQKFTEVSQPKVEEQKPEKALPITVSEQKPIEKPKVSDTKPLPKVLPKPTVEIPKPVIPKPTAQTQNTPEPKKETIIEEAKILEKSEDKLEKVESNKVVEEVKPLPVLKELPQQTSLPVVDSPTKPLPVVPKKPVKALPIVSPKLKEEKKDVFESSPKLPPLPVVPVTEPESPKPSTPVVETTQERVETKVSEPSPTLSRTASIRSYFSSFLSKNKKPSVEVKEVENPQPTVEPVVEDSIEDEPSNKESDNETTEHSVVNIDDFLSDGDTESHVEELKVVGQQIETSVPIQVEKEEKSEQKKEEFLGADLLTSVLESTLIEKSGSEGRKESITSTTDSQCSSSEKSECRKSKRANRKKTISPHQKETGSLLLSDFLDSNPSSRSSSTKKEEPQEVIEVVEHAALEDFIGEDCAMLSTISETNTTTSNTHPSPSRSDSTHTDTTPLANTPKSLLDLYSPITPKRKEKLFDNFVDPSSFPKGWEKPYTFLYTEKPLMEHPLLDKLRRNIIDLLNSCMNEENRVSGIVNINRTSPLLAPLVHSIYSILINRTKPTIFKSDRDLCTIFSKLEIVKKEKIVQDFLAFKEVRILDPKKLKERDLLLIQYLLQSKLLAVCTYELALNQKYTAICYEETSIMNLTEYSPTIFAVLNLLKKHFNFELKFEFELSQQAGGSKEEGTLTSTLQGNVKTLLQYIIEIGKNEKIPINAITDESKNHNIGKVVRSLIMYILRSILMDKLISESKWKNIAGTLISHPWHLITACAKGELTKVGMNVKTGYSFDSIVLTIDSTVKKKNQTTKQQLLDDKFFSFVAYCLNYQILTDALKFIFKNIMILEKNYRPDSIMCDPVQQDQILTILAPLSKLRFTLNFY